MMESETDSNTNLCYISKKDMEIFRTVRFISQLENRQEEIRDSLLDEYNKDTGNVETALAFGIFNMLVCNTENPLEGLMYVESTFAAFDSILVKEPGHWLARILRCYLFSAMPTRFRDEEAIIKELKELAEKQGNSVYQPYFMLTYILMAEFYNAICDNANMAKSIEMADQLPKAPVRVLADFLISPVINFESKLKKSGETELANTVYKLRESFFPGNIK